MCLAAVLSLAAPAVAGQSKPNAPGVFSAQRLEPFVRQAVEAGPARQPSQGAAGRSPRRDSIWNGGLIGAAIGGVGGSALIVASHGGSDDIPRAMLNVCVPPALAGFAVGAMIDALR
jgi:hypothetical protein